MSAKQALLDFVRELTEDEAEGLLWVTDLGSHGGPELSEDDLAAIRRGMDDARAGRLVEHSEMRRRYGLES